jgi:hypothetical protein
VCKESVDFLPLVCHHERLVRPRPPAATWFTLQQPHKETLIALFPHHSEPSMLLSHSGNTNHLRQLMVCYLGSVSPGRRPGSVLGLTGGKRQSSHFLLSEKLRITLNMACSPGRKQDNSNRLFPGCHWKWNWPRHS